MRRKGFTLVELLVVIAIIALLMGILMPALARVRQLAFRMTCGSNLSGIGKAMHIYAGDYDDEMPRAGTRTATWGEVKFDAATPVAAFTVTATDSKASISSCFYLLVKYADVTPASFICKGDTDAKVFKPGTTTANVPIDVTQLYDFGPSPSTACSYSMHMPFGTTAITLSSDQAMPVASERNPWMVNSSDTQKTFPSNSDGSRKFQGKAGDADDQTYGNAVTHQEDGQNVLFVDTHVDFAKRSYCGLEDDNIFTQATSTSIDCGTFPSAFASNLRPLNRKDSLLVTDPAKFTTGTTR